MQQNYQGLYDRPVCSTKIPEISSHVWTSVDTVEIWRRDTENSGKHKKRYLRFQWLLRVSRICDDISIGSYIQYIGVKCKEPILNWFPKETTKHWRPQTYSQHIWLFAFCCIFFGKCTKLKIQSSHRMTRTPNWRSFGRKNPWFSPRDLAIWQADKSNQVERGILH